MKVLFTVQGVGRGHLTQALAVSEILQRNRHQVVAVLTGLHGNRSLPDYFEAALSVPVERIISPSFVFKRDRGVHLLGTLGSVLGQLRHYRRSLASIETAIARTRPDLIINFLEPMMGAFSLLKRHGVPVITVGHQFMLEHPRFPRTRRYELQQMVMKRFIRLTAARSVRLALSFYDAPDLPEQRLFVCPPLLRGQLFQLNPEPGRYVLIYFVTAGYAEDVRLWHAAHPEVELHCFCDRPGAPAIERMDPTLTFHAIDGAKFLRMMASCRAVVCTAGVESISEAAWLGKPLLMVPIENHVEQFLNTLDAGPNHGALGIADTHFSLSRLLEDYPLKPNLAFRNWLQKAQSVFLRVAETEVKRARGQSVTHPRTAPQSA